MPHTYTRQPLAADLLIAFAATGDAAALQALQALPKASALANLARLLQGMQRLPSSPQNPAGALSLSTPHEKALASLHSPDLSHADAHADGLIPLAAQHAWANFGSQSLGQGWAWITPCYWAMGREQASMTNPAQLDLPAAQSGQLMAAMQPYFATEGINLHYAAPDCWLAEGELFKTLPTASLDRVIGRNVDAWLPGNEAQPSAPLAAKKIKLLQNEMQMLLYTHAINDERNRLKLFPINSFWLSGSGTLAQAPGATSPATLQPRSLAKAVFAGDWAAYAQAWQALDQQEIAALLARQNSGEKVRLTLCGESHYQVFESRPRTLGLRLASWLKPASALGELGRLGGL